MSNELTTNGNDVMTSETTQQTSTEVEVVVNNTVEANTSTTNAIETTAVTAQNQGVIEPESGQVLSKYNSEADYTLALNSVVTEIESAIKFADESNDWKDIRTKLTNAKDKLIALFLRDEDNSRLMEMINESYEKVNQRQSLAREEFEKESHENYLVVKVKVETAVKESLESTEFKHSRELLLNAQNEFKNLKLKRSHRDELYDMINKAFEEISRKQMEERENFEMECIENYHNIKSKIDGLVEKSNTTTDFNVTRDELIDIQKQIKELKLKRDQREELFQTIRDCFEVLNKRQREERLSMDTEVTTNYAKMKKIVDDAIAFTTDNENYQDARDMLINAQAAIKGVKLRKEMRDELYQMIREVFSELNSKQSQERESFDSECAENYSKLTAKVNDCFNLVHGVTEFKLIRESLITVQSEVKIVKLKKEQRNELFSRIREAFNIFDKKKKEYFDKINEEKRSKLIAIKDNLDTKIRRLEETLISDKQALETAKDKVDAEVSEEEKANKIRLIEERIKEKEGRIAESKTRIEDIEKEIEAIK